MHVSTFKIISITIFGETYAMYLLAVNCQWSSWGVWSQCSVTCGSGTKTKSRTKLTIARNGGRDCAGSSTYSSTCSSTYQCQSRLSFHNNARYSSTSNTGSTRSKSRRCRNQSSSTAKFFCENSAGRDPLGSLAGATIEAFAKNPIGQVVYGLGGLLDG